MMSARVLGVLGGMGPLASVDFQRKLIELTPVRVDQDHIPCITYSLPQIPCRVSAILDGGPSPLPTLLKGIDTLERAGVDAIAVPCVTAHYWFEAMDSATCLPIFDMATATIEVLSEPEHAGMPIGVLATQATLSAGHFQKSLTQAGFELMTPGKRDMEMSVLPAISNVKVGNFDKALRLGVEAVENLLADGAARVVLACTELPVALNNAPDCVKSRCIDTVDALARACVAWAKP